jgi:5,10-methylenetetrahydrofolate reductase
MVVAGGHISYGDHHTARSVEDIDLMELLNAIQMLQKGRDMAGVELTGSPSFLVGSTVTAQINGGASDADLEDMDRKIAAGVEFFVTQPIFDLQAFAGFMKRVGDRKAKIIPTILLLKSLGMARYIDRHLENVSIPAFFLRRIQKSPDKVQDCIKIAADLISDLKNEGCSGVLVSTIGWEDKLPAILDKVK